MQTNHKRLIFFFLSSLFLVYTIMVATTGTENDKGSEFLTQDARKGKLVFQEYNCVSCHQLYGLGGYMGPDLTNVISATGKGKDYAAVFIEFGTDRMPKLGLSREEVKQVIAYLEYVDKTGISPVKKFNIEWNGIVSQPHEK